MSLATKEPDSINATFKDRYKKMIDLTVNYASNQGAEKVVPIGNQKILVHYEEQFVAWIKQIADSVRVEAERNRLSGKRLYR